MTSSEQLLEIGSIRKAHGLRGEVVVRLVTNRLERLAPGTSLDADGGTLSVVASRPHQGDHLVLFEGVDDRHGAEGLRGVVLRALPLHDEDELWVHKVIGCSVVDQHGVQRGSVTSVLANPASDLLVLESGALVPMTFIDRIEHGTVIVDGPDGLFDLGA